MSDVTSGAPPARVEDLLLPQHLADLRRSGLSDEQIIRAKLQSVEDAGFVAGRLNRNLSDCQPLGPFLAFPFINADGKNPDRFTRFKPDNPRKGDKDKSIKYESPIGKPNRLYIPPATWPAIKDASVPLLITEGEKKALKADQDGFPCVGLIGVYGWVAKSKGKAKAKLERKQLIPDMLGIAWASRKAFIVFDSDLADNETVRYAVRDLAAALIELGASVFVVFLAPAADASKVGLDDYLVCHTPDQFRALLDGAKPLAAVAPEPESDERKPLGANRKSEGDEPDNPHRLAAELLGTGKNGHPLWLRYWRETFYEWTGSAYRKITDSAMKAVVTGFARRRFVELNKLELLAYAANPSEDKKRPATKPVTGELVGNVLNALRSLCLVADEMEPPVWLDGLTDNLDPRFLLAGPNGLLDVAAAAAGDQVQLSAPDPELFNLVAVTYPLQPHAPAPKLWLKFLSQVWPDDMESVQCLQEWFGLALSGDTSFQKMVWLIGPSRAGKGVINHVLTHLVGAANVCTPSLYDFGTEFGLSSMLGKTLAIVGDGRISNRADAVQVTARLLQIVGEDGIDVNRKNKAIVENTKLRVRVVVAANELPALVDNSDAMLKRSLVLRFTKSFSGREDTALREKLETELPSIMWWAIEGLANLRLRGRFSEPSSGTQLKNRLAALLSPVGTFIQERCVIEEGARVEKTTLYIEWTSWCEDMGRKEKGTQEVFGRNLFAALSGLKEVRVQDPRDRKRRPWCYSGVRLRTLEEGDPHNGMNPDSYPNAEPGQPGQTRLFLDDDLVA